MCWEFVDKVHGIQCLWSKVSYSNKKVQLFHNNRHFWINIKALPNKNMIYYTKHYMVFETYNTMLGESKKIPKPKKIWLDTLDTTMLLTKIIWFSSFCFPPFLLWNKGTIYAYLFGGVIFEGVYYMECLW